MKIFKRLNYWGIEKFHIGNDVTLLPINLHLGFHRPSFNKHCNDDLYLFNINTTVTFEASIETLRKQN